MQLLGEILMATAGIPKAAVTRALQAQDEKGGRLGEILIGQKIITETDLLQALARQFHLQYTDDLPTEADSFFTALVPIYYLKKYKMVPIRREMQDLIVINDPLQLSALDDLRRIVGMGKSSKTVLATAGRIQALINQAYDTSGDTAEQVIQDMHEGSPEEIFSAINETGDLLDDTSDAPVIKLVNLILSQAIREGASDVHFEPYKDRLKIRQRVDGILYDMYMPPSHIQSALISRIKVMADLNIAEKRLPQDGRIEIRLADKTIDIRVSTIPASHGERVVLRLLHKSNVLIKLTDLGMPADRLKTFNQLIHAAHGIILVTGPTGSGKTTTLYAALTTINNSDINIITVEDPIEYRIDGIGQMQVNPKIGLTFGKGLRSIVRQDPDVILIGEIRDLETAEIAIQSALTGHLVFSTLHTNDSASSVTRLIDMGIESFMVTSSVNAILAQRLIRQLCPKCKEAYEPDEEALATMGLDQKILGTATIYRHKGCPMCLQTGYKGRSGIFELLALDDDIKSIIIKTSDSNAIKKAGVSKGMITLRQDGIKKIATGATSIEEVFRVTQN